MCVCKQQHACILAAFFAVHCLRSWVSSHAMTLPMAARTPQLSTSGVNVCDPTLPTGRIPLRRSMAPCATTVLWRSQTSAAYVDKSFRGGSCDPSVKGGDAWPGVTLALETEQFVEAPADGSVHSVVGVHAWDPSCEPHARQAKVADAV